MRSIVRLLFNVWILPLLGKFVVTPTILTTIVAAGGEKIVRSSLLLDNTYPILGYLVTPSMFGLQRFKPNDAGTSLVDPFVVSVSGQPVLARIVGGLLLLSYPSGGATASPASPAAPFVTAGATPVTGTAATATLTPGVGKDWVNGADASTITVVVSAVGY